ncbi:MAG: ATPase [Caulobacter sp.]|jgi:chaperone required for assembly of F1-ATPase|nr:ATPase [Caulobacter sp.]
MALKGPDDTVQTARRFYKAVTVEPSHGGFAVLLDGRSPKSPGGLAMVVPTRALAELVAEEWARQEEFILMARMPATRLAFTALEKTAPSRAALAEEFARYAGSDALCYFADQPSELIARQTAAWEPVLQWAEEEHNLAFERAAGVIHRPQPARTLEQARALALAMDDFSLIALLSATSLFGSALLALAVQRGRLSGEEAHDLARVDEAFQEERWGVDEEAAERTANRLAEAHMLGAWFAALR